MIKKIILPLLMVSLPFFVSQAEGPVLRIWGILKRRKGNRKVLKGKSPLYFR